jgi:hypothetical protein
MATETIPLKCITCPKKPVFSDISHLLTHVSSKGHLAAYFRLKVKAVTDPEVDALVTEYDNWYSEWGIQDLMSERMTQKDNKKHPRKSSMLLLFSSSLPLFSNKRL